MAELGLYKVLAHVRASNGSEALVMLDDSEEAREAWKLLKKLEDRYFFEGGHPGGMTAFPAAGGGSE